MLPPAYICWLFKPIFICTGSTSAQSPSAPERAELGVDDVSLRSRVPQLHLELRDQCRQPVSLGVKRLQLPRLLLVRSPDFVYALDCLLVEALGLVQSPGLPVQVQNGCWCGFAALANIFGILTADRKLESPVFSIQKEIADAHDRSFKLAMDWNAERTHSWASSA